MQPEGANNLRQTRAGADVVNQMAKIYSPPAGRSKQPYKAKSGVDCDYFVLIAAMNPYPCGCSGDLQRGCMTCAPALLSRYQERISGRPLERNGM